MAVLVQRDRYYVAGVSEGARVGIEYRRIACRFLAGAWLISLFGCLDPLPEGTFACSEEGRNSGCPRGWYCRYGDEAENELRCYSTPGEQSAPRADAAIAGGDPDEDSGVDDADSGAEDGGAERSENVDGSDASAEDGGMDGGTV